MQYNSIRPDYSRFGDGKQLVLPIDTEVLIPANDSVRLLSQVMEELEYSKLYEAYSPKGRKAAVAPKSLFKVLVYGYMCGHYSSRALERACCRDINFMYLLAGDKAPDYSTIARFRSGVYRKLKVPEKIISKSGKNHEKFPGKIVIKKGQLKDCSSTNILCCRTNHSKGG